MQSEMSADSMSVQTTTMTKQYAAKSYGHRKAVAVLALVGSAITLSFAGCISGPSNPAATQPATVLDLATTQPSYWYAQPAAATAHTDNFDALWAACDSAARDFLFQIDRTDYRDGVMTTKPLTSRQWFEFWRRDVRTIKDLNESSTAAIRRTVRFEIVRQPDDTFVMTPKVLIEREAQAEHRITSVVNYGSIYSRPVKPRDVPQGTRESDVSVNLPGRYWYPTGRDSALETAIVETVQRMIARSSRS